MIKSYEGPGPSAWDGSVAQVPKPNDPSFDKNWAVDKIGARDAWEYSKGEGIVVAVLDTGVDYDHVDLVGNMWVNEGEIPGDGRDNDGNGYADDIHGWNFSDSGLGSDVDDRRSHGTHVAGIIAAQDDNGIGIAGIAPDAEIMAVKVFPDGGRGNYEDIVHGIEYAIKMGADIINMSLSGGSPWYRLENALRMAQEAGIIVTASAGNDGKDGAGYPAAYTKQFDNILSVAATTSGDKVTNYSNYSSDGLTVDIAAPGNGIVSTTKGNGFGSQSGTSMAAPVIAGAAAVVWGANPDLTYLEVIEALEATVDPLANLNKPFATNGRVNLAEAVTYHDVPTVLNRDPDAQDDGPFDAVAGQATAVSLATLLVNDTDRDGDTLAIADIVSVAGGTAKIVNSTLVFTGNAPGTAAVTYLVSDGKGGTDEASVTFDVAAPAPAPPSGMVALGQAGVFEMPSDQVKNDWFSVAFDRVIEDAVVVMGPATFNGGQPVNVRVRDITDTGFSFQIDEWDYLDGSHLAEDIGWMAISAGTHTLADGRTISAGSLDMGSNAPNSRAVQFETVDFGGAFDDTPVVFSQVSSYNGGQAVTTRHRDVSKTGFSVGLQEEEGRDGSHAVEDIGWIALETGLAGDVAVGTTGNVVTHDHFEFDFGTSYADGPALLAQMQTFDGGDTATVRARDMDASGATIFIEEEQSRDDEMSHTTEDVGWATFAQGFLTGEADTLFV